MAGPFAISQPFRERKKDQPVAPSRVGSDASARWSSVERRQGHFAYMPRIIPVRVNSEAGGVTCCCVVVVVVVVVVAAGCSDAQEFRIMPSTGSTKVKTSFLM